MVSLVSMVVSIESGTEIQNDVVWWYDDGYEIRNLYNPNGKLKSRPQICNIF